MAESMEIIDNAIKQGRMVLSEHESKKVFAAYQIPVTREIYIDHVQNVVEAAKTIGYPLVLKGCSSEIAHKTEKGLIRVDIRSEAEVIAACQEMMDRMSGCKERGILVQEMVKGSRELVVGLTRDPQFGPCVMFGLGGIFTEILKDISFRIAPLEKGDAMEMMKEIRGYKILEGVRGMEAADLDCLANILVSMGEIGIDHNRIKEIDINPLIISGNKPVAVDGLIILD